MTHTVLLVWLANSAVGDTCDSWSSPDPGVTILGGLVTESSGLAASRKRPDLLFTHNDKGDEPRLFVLDLSGHLVDEHPVKRATHTDWEDLAAAPCPTGGDCVYIGDIGDNDRNRDDITVFVVQEPDDGKRARTIETWTGEYPDGPHDAETLLVHPCTGGVAVVTKEASGLARVYRFPPFPGRKTVVLDFIGEVTSGGETLPITGGDFNQEGDRVILRTSEALWEWNVDPDAPHAHWEDDPMLVAELDANAGEAVTYGLEGDLYVTSEGPNALLRAVQCTAILPSSHDCVYPTQSRCGCTTSPNAPHLPLVVAAWVPWLRRRRHPRTQHKTKPEHQVCG